jgi:hypothetical protein
MRIVYPTTIDHIHRGKFEASWSYLHGDVEYDHGYDIFTCNEAMHRAVVKSQADDEFTCTIICPTTYKRRDGVAIWVGNHGHFKPYPFVYVCYADDTEAIEGARAMRPRARRSGRPYHRVVWYEDWVRQCLRKGVSKDKLRDWLSDGINREWFHELQYNERTKDIVFRANGYYGDEYYRASTSDIGHAKRMCRAIHHHELLKMGFLKPLFKTSKRGTIQ